MNWTMVLIGFSLAVLTGAAAAALLGQNRPHWPRRRRLIISASVLPAITLLGTLATVWFIKESKHDASQSMEDLAVTAVLTLGAGFIILAFIGGLIGASLSQRRG